MITTFLNFNSKNGLDSNIAQLWYSYKVFV